MENEKKTNEAGQSMLSYVGKATTGYTKKKGQIVCNRGEQADQIIKLLKKSYKSVTQEDGKGGKVIIKFSKDDYQGESLSESFTGELADATDGRFWTRKDELISDIKALGYDVTDYNDEYLTVVDPKNDDRGECIVYIGKANNTLWVKRITMPSNNDQVEEGLSSIRLGIGAREQDRIFDDIRDDTSWYTTEYNCDFDLRDHSMTIRGERPDLERLIKDYHLEDYGAVIEDGKVDEDASSENKEDNKQLLFVIKDSHGNQLSSPSPDDRELYDRIYAMGQRGRRGLSVVVYTGESIEEDCSSQDLLGKYPVVASDGARSVFVRAFDKLPDAVKYCEDNEWTYERSDGKRWILDIKGRIDSASGSETFLKRNPCEEALHDGEEEVEIKEFVRDPNFKDIPNDYVFWDTENGIDFPDSGTDKKALYDKVLDVLKPEEIDYENLSVWVDRDDDYEEISWTYHVSDSEGRDAVDSYFENIPKLTMGDLRALSYEKLMSDFEDQFYDRAVEDAEENYDPDDYVDWDNMPGGHDWLADRRLDMGEAVEKIPYFYIELNDGPGGIDSTGRLVEFPDEFLEIDDPGEASALADYYSRKYGRKCVVRKGTYHVDGDKLIGKTDADYVDEAIDSDPYGQDNGFFTRDDLNEFTDACLADLGDGYDVSYSYITDGLLEVAFEKDGYEMRADERIDMRKIKLPSDLLKYKDSVVQKVRADYEDNIKAAQ